MIVYQLHQLSLYGIIFIAVFTATTIMPNVLYLAMIPATLQVATTFVNHGWICNNSEFIWYYFVILHMFIQIIWYWISKLQFDIGE